jgi:hypothetical protein
VSKITKPTGRETTMFFDSNKKEKRENYLFIYLFIYLDMLLLLLSVIGITQRSVNIPLKILPLKMRFSFDFILFFVSK